MRYSGERMVPWNRACGVTVMHHHVARYAWVLPMVFGKNVIDLGCGTGYGSFMMSWVAQHVTGVDMDKKTIDYARARFVARNLVFECGDITRLAFKKGTFVAFEVLEHLRHPEKVTEYCKPLIWSIPVNVPSPFHERAYSVEEIDELMGGGTWFQGRDGTILDRDVAWFDPLYVLGVLN